MRFVEFAFFLFRKPQMVINFVDFTRAWRDPDKRLTVPKTICHELTSPRDSFMFFEDKVSEVAKFSQLKVKPAIDVEILL